MYQTALYYGIFDTFLSLFFVTTRTDAILYLSMLSVPYVPYVSP